MAHKAAAVVATSRPHPLLARLGRWLHAGLALLAGSQAAQALTLPEDKSEATFHAYDGGGVRATGPAVLVRKSLAGKVSLSGQVYVDMVSNASVDVVTTASPYRERRTATEIGADWLVRDTLISIGLAGSKEPDYQARNLSLDVAQEVFGGMSTISLGASRGADKVGQRGTPGWLDRATHWNYRLGLSQVLSPRWMATANLEILADTGLLASPYRSARVFGAAVPERLPRTRTGRALKLRLVGDTDALVKRSSLRAEVRYYWDTWDLKAHTFELGASRYFGQAFLADASLRVYQQSAALFYSDNAQADRVYVSRNRQLGTMANVGLAGRLAWSLPRREGGWDWRLVGAYEYKRFDFKDFTDLRTGSPYQHGAHLMQLSVTATY